MRTSLTQLGSAHAGATARLEAEVRDSLKQNDLLSSRLASTEARCSSLAAEVEGRLAQVAPVYHR
jgi:hypothetical protein